MAIDVTSRNSAYDTGASGSSDGLHNLLAGYASAIQKINESAPIVWHKLDESRYFGWMRVPVLRGLVRILLVRHLSRCVSALKHGAARWAALDSDPTGPKRDLEMLEHFEKSLPTKLRLALVWPFGLIVVMFAAFGLAAVAKADFAKLLGDLTMAALSLNRSAALAAITNTHRQVVQVAQDDVHAASTDVAAFAAEAIWYSTAATIVLWSAMVFVLPLLPASRITRQLLAPLKADEASCFSEFKAQGVHEAELDLVAYLLQIPVLALFTVNVLAQKHPTAIAQLAAGVAFVVTVFAGLELRRRYTARRDAAGRDDQHRQGNVVTRSSLRVACALSLGIIVVMVSNGLNMASQDWPSKIGKEQWLQELHFRMTEITQNAECNDQYAQLLPGQQFLRFGLEVWSTVDQFSDPGTPGALTLRHWSVEYNANEPAEKNLFMYAKCGYGTETILEPATPGRHTKTIVVIGAPKEATSLRLEVLRDHLRHHISWPIPSPLTGS